MAPLRYRRAFCPGRLKGRMCHMGQVSTEADRGTDGAAMGKSCATGKVVAGKHGIAGRRRMTIPNHPLWRELAEFMGERFRPDWCNDGDAKAYEELQRYPDVASFY